MEVESRKGRDREIIKGEGKVESRDKTHRVIEERNRRKRDDIKSREGEIQRTGRRGRANKTEM